MQPSEITLRVLGERAWGLTGFSIAMAERRPVSDWIAGYTFHSYGDWFKIMRDPIAVEVSTCTE